MEHPDLTGMSPQEAREYVLRHILALRETHRQLKQARDELETWARRRTLAAQADNPKLLEEAIRRHDAAEAKIGGLASERAELERTVGTLKRELSRLEAAPQRLVDADELLARLEMLVGDQSDTDEVDRSLRNIEVDAELQALKKKLEDSD